MSVYTALYIFFNYKFIQGRSITDQNMEILDNLSQIILERLTSAENGVEIITEEFGFLFKRKSAANSGIYTSLLEAAVSIPSFQEMNIEQSPREVNHDVSDVTRS